MKCSSHLALHSDPAQQLRAWIWLGWQEELGLQIAITFAVLYPELSNQLPPGSGQGFSSSRPALGAGGPGGALGGSRPTASAGKRQQRRGYVEGWERGWSGLRSHCWSGLSSHCWSGLSSHCWSIPGPAESSRVCSPSLSRTQWHREGTSRHCWDAPAKHQRFPSWRSSWSSVPSQGHISKEKWKHYPCSSACWTCSRRQSLWGRQRVCNVCRTRGVFPLSQERSCLPGQPSKAQRSSDMGAAGPRALVAQGWHPLAPLGTLGAGELRGGAARWEPAAGLLQKVSNIHQPPESIV